MCALSFKSTLTRTRLPSSASHTVRSAKRFDLLLCLLVCLSVCRTVVAKSKVLWPLIAFVPSCHSVILASATELSSSW